MSDNEIKFEILRNEKYGRYLVAKQDLQAGEMIFTDKPFAVGPKPDSPAMCLSCYCPWDGSYVCSRCSWPCCGAACERAPAHANNECAVFAAARVRFQPVDDYTAACTQLDCITPLRMILAKERDEKRWSEQLECMESHTESRQQRPAWAADEVNVARFLVDHCKLSDRFNVELLQRVCGILEVNSVEIPSRGCFSIRAIYPQLAVAAHACVPNIVHTIHTGDSTDPDYVAQVRAAVPIKKGEILHLCYTYVLYPTTYRREFLKESKFFDCDCKRCSDPKELGTNMSTLKCNKCDPGVILSTDPLDAMAQWKCTHCEFSTSGPAVRKILMIVQNEIDQTEEIAPGAEAIEVREQLLRKYRSVFHPKHSCLISLKHSLSQLYGRVEGYNLGELPDILLERKMELCRQILEVLDVINPGESRMRGMMLYELHAPLLLLAKNEFKCGTLLAEKLKERMMEPMELLKESAQILSREDPASPEGIIGQVAVQSLQELQNSVASLTHEKK